MTCSLWDVLNRDIQCHVELDRHEPTIRMISGTPGDEPKNILVDDVSIWCDGEFVFIWSCDNVTRTEHEEALMIKVYKDKFTFLVNQTEYKEMMEKSYTTARKYLNQSQILLQEQITSSDNASNRFSRYFSGLDMALTLTLALVLVVFLGINVWNTLKH